MRWGEGQKKETFGYGTARQKGKRVNGRVIGGPQEPADERDRRALTRCREGFFLPLARVAEPSADITSPDHFLRIQISTNCAGILSRFLLYRITDVIGQRDFVNTGAN